MIGVFVKGGKLPKSCWKCEYGNTDGVSHVCPFYCENHVKQSDWSEERHPQCPLEQIIEPPKEQPQKGKWTVDEYNIHHCPFCKAINNTVYQNFCPNCGADMREVE